MPDGTRQDALDGALQLLIDDVTAKYADLLRHKPGQRDVEEDVLKLLPTRDFEFQVCLGDSLHDIPLTVDDAEERARSRLD